MHRYTNIRDGDMSLPPLKGKIDDEIPLVPCDRIDKTETVWDQSATHWCPDYRA